MKRAMFETLVRRAIERLPKRFRDHLGTVEFVIQDRASPELLASLEIPPEEDDLLGFYDGVPITERSDFDGAPIPVTDTIYLFQKALEEMCASEDELVEEIRVTVLHEIGHHFGFDDDEIERLGYG